MTTYRITANDVLVATGVEVEYARFALTILAEAGVPTRIDDSEGHVVAIIRKDSGLSFADDALLSEE